MPQHPDLGLAFAFLEMTVLRKVGILEVSVAIVFGLVTAPVFVPLPKPTTS